MNVGDYVRLRGKSRRGENKLNQHGNHWKVVDIRPNRLLLGTYFDDKDLRWVNLPEDADFQIMETWTPATAMADRLAERLKDES